MTTPAVFISKRCILALAFDVTLKITRPSFIANVCLCNNQRQLTRHLMLITSLLMTLAASLPLHAQTFQVLEELLLKHPQLQTMSYRASSNRERSDAAMGLPDPIVSLGINNFPIFDSSFSEFLPTNKAIGLQQRFPSRTVRRARSAMGQAEANQFDQKRKQLFSAMRAELIASLHHKNRIVLQRSLAKQRDIKYDQLIDTVESAVQGGRPSVFRLAEIEAERADVARDLIDLDAQEAQIDARLIYLVELIPDTPAPVTPAPTKSSDAWSGDSMMFHASRVAGAAVEVLDSGVDEAKAAWKPEWGAQLIYQQREAGRNFAGDDWVSIMVTVTVPFWAKKKQAPRLRAAQASKAAAQAALEDVKRQAEAQYTYSNAVHAATIQAELVLHQKIDAISDEISAQRANYESGAGDYTAVIDGEITILKLRAEIAAEQARGQVAVAQMNALLVTP
jgi:cobalt-zinc-cadmium efflux system outer membrane protein